jgi:hypothetical protein
MALRLSGESQLTGLFLAVAAPFFVDAVFSLLATYAAFVMDFSQNLKQELIEGATFEERKFLPILSKRFEEYVYAKTDEQFAPELCNESFKNKAFEGRHLSLQLTSVVLIFAQIYFSIMSAVHSTIAPVFSVFVTVYALTSLFCFFGLNSHKLVGMSQSTLISLKYAAIALGYLFETLRNGGFNYEISFFVMTALLVADALLGYSLLATRKDFSTEVRNYQAMETSTIGFFFDNWKTHQFRTIHKQQKILAFALVGFQMVFALSAFFTYSGLHVTHFFISYHILE